MWDIIDSLQGLMRMVWPDSGFMMWLLGLMMVFFHLLVMNTMMDSTPSHIAEMAIQGANMGITDLQSLLNRYDNEACFDEARKMAEGSIRFNEKVIEDMKKYLG